MKLRSFISRLNKLNAAYLLEFPIWYSRTSPRTKLWIPFTIPCLPHVKTRWLNKGSITQIILWKITDFFESRVENLEPREEKKKSSPSSKNKQEEKANKKRQQGDYDSSVVESSRYCILHGKCSHTTDNC